MTEKNILLHKVLHCTGLLIFRGKKAKFRGIFRGKFAEKSADFAGFSQGKQVEIRKKIGRFRWGLAAKSQISKDFQGQIRGKIGRFRGKIKSKFAEKSADFAGV